MPKRLYELDNPEVDFDDDINEDQAEAENQNNIGNRQNQNNNEIGNRQNQNNNEIGNRQNRNNNRNANQNRNPNEAGNERADRNQAENQNHNREQIEEQLPEIDIVEVPERKLREAEDIWKKRSRFTIENDIEAFQEKMDEERRRRNENNQRQAEQQKAKQNANQQKVKNPKQKEKPPVGDEKKVPKKIVNRYKGTVNAQPEIEETLLDKQQKQVHSLRFLTREVTFGARRGFSSPEFRNIKKHLYILDQYMKQIAGRTSLTKEEMERYELLTRNAYLACKKYMKKKDAQDKALLSKGKKPSVYDQKRRLAIKEVMKSISGMRQKIYEKDFKRMKDELRNECQDKMNDLQEAMDGLAHAGAKHEVIKEALTESVSSTLYYMNRMDSLDKSMKINWLHSYKNVKNQMNIEIEPTQQDLQNIANHELTKKIVDQGMKRIQEGEKLTVDDIQKIQNDYIQRNARKITQQKRRENIQKQNQKQKNQPEIKQPKPASAL